MEDYFIIASLIFIGAICAFFSGIIANISLEKLNARLKDNDAEAEKIDKIRDRFENHFNTYFLIEMFVYAVSAILSGGLYYTDFSNLDNSWQYMIYLILAYFNITILLRYIFSAIGRRYADNLAYRLASFLFFLSHISKPFVSLIAAIDLKVGGKNTDDSLGELEDIVDTALEDGAIDQGEYRIFKNLIHFSDVSATDVMTPRTVLFSCEADKTVEEVINLPELKMYSRFPVWDGESLDDGVVGYVMTRDVLHAGLTGKSQKKLREFAREVYFIPENAGLDDALDRFLQRRQHLFLVVDEYGGIEGILTMEDVLETILGAEIVDEADKVVDLRVLAKQRRDMRIASLNKKD